MTKVLYFNSDSEAKLVNTKVEDGWIELEDKKFLVDTATPLMLHTRFGVEPLYLLKWNSLEPAKNVNPPKPEKLKEKAKLIKKLLQEKKILKGNGEMVVVQPNFEDSISKGLTPKLVKQLMDIKILGNMIPVKKKVQISGFVQFIVGVALGIFIMYYLAYAGVIHI